MLRLLSFIQCPFQPTRPLRGATDELTHPSNHRGISTHAPLAGRDYDPSPLFWFYYISTHAPLAGRDSQRPRRTKPTSISTHAPLAGRDLLWIGSAIRFSSFQPTRPLRGATFILHCIDGDAVNFNPRAPCGARPCSVRDRCHKYFIFQPTRPLRGATASDMEAVMPSLFQPTRPLRGATNFLSLRALPLRFQPTRPLRGATEKRRRVINSTTNFNPRAPCGARLHNLEEIESKVEISTHAPLAGRDQICQQIKQTR